MNIVTAEDMAKRLFGVVDEQSKALVKVQKALKSLTDNATLESPGKVEEACRQLEAFDPGAFGLNIDFEDFLSLTKEDQQKRAGKRKVEFGRNLKALSDREGVSCELITMDPMEFSLPPFTVAVNLEKNLAAICYARIAIEEVSANPEKIMAALQKNLKLLDAGWSGEDFFDALHHAYQIELFEKKGHPGDRVSLIKLLPSVALSFQTAKFRADPVSNHYRTYGRVRMAYDLAGLRRNGLLAQNGMRLNLGTATGAATKNKKDVLYIEEGSGKGQYYLSVWFSSSSNEVHP